MALKDLDDAFKLVLEIGEGDEIPLGRISYTHGKYPLYPSRWSGDMASNGTRIVGYRADVWGWKHDFTLFFGRKFSVSFGWTQLKGKKDAKSL